MGLHDGATSAELAALRLRRSRHVVRRDSGASRAAGSALNLTPALAIAFCDDSDGANHSRSIHVLTGVIVR